jgi:nucleoside-diphosphate-sugar epimerase
LRILVTGGTGFVGGHVVEHLLADGCEVTILSRASSLRDGIPAGVRARVGDLADAASLRAACASQDAVVHAAGLVGAGATWADYRRVNVSGTRRLIRAAIASGVPRLVHVSSLVVHAEPGRGELVREASPLLRRVAGWNHYARSKLLAERILHRAANSGRIATVVIRPGLVLGPRDRWTTPWLLRRLSQPAQLLVGNGRNAIPCVSVEDLADAITRAVVQRAAGSDAFDIAADCVMSQRDLIAAHARASGRAFSPVRIPAAAARAGAVLRDVLNEVRRVRVSPPHRMAAAIAGVHAQVDSSHAAAGLGWRATGSCEDAIRRAVDWELAHSERSRPGSWRDPHGSRRGHQQATT